MVAIEQLTVEIARLAEAVRVMACELYEARAEVERLRARVRSVDRSTDYNGKAFSDGESSQEDLANVAAERDAARAKVAEVEAERDHERTVANEQLARAHDAVSERDEARAEVERLRALLAAAYGYSTGDER